MRLACLHFFQGPSITPAIIHCPQTLASLVFQALASLEKGLVPPPPTRMGLLGHPVLCTEQRRVSVPPARRQLLLDSPAPIVLANQVSPL